MPFGKTLAFACGSWLLLDSLLRRQLYESITVLGCKSGLLEGRKELGSYWSVWKLSVYHIAFKDDEKKNLVALLDGTMRVCWHLCGWPPTTAGGFTQHLPAL
jgi:hypothetical protein